MALIAFYPGSFDPPTNGHVDIVRQALRIADTLIVAIGLNGTKTPLFTIEERLDMLAEIGASLAKERGSAFEAVAFSGLTVEAARHHEATLLIRGLRDAADLDDEMRLAGMNAALAPEIGTVFLPASKECRSISSTLVRQIAAMGGDVSPFVPPLVAERLKSRREPG